MPSRAVIGPAMIDVRFQAFSARQFGKKAVVCWTRNTVIQVNRLPNCSRWAAEASAPGESCAMGFLKNVCALGRACGFNWAVFTLSKHSVQRFGKEKLHFVYMVWRCHAISASVPMYREEPIPKKVPEDPRNRHAPGKHPHRGSCNVSFQAHDVSGSECLYSFFLAELSLVQTPRPRLIDPQAWRFDPGLHVQ